MEGTAAWKAGGRFLPGQMREWLFCPISKRKICFQKNGKPQHTFWRAAVFMALLGLLPAAYSKPLGIPYLQQMVLTLVAAWPFVPNSCMAACKIRSRVSSVFSSCLVGRIPPIKIEQTV